MAAKVNNFHTSLEKIKIQNKENLNRYLINLDNAKCVLYSTNEENKAFAKEMELYVQSLLINVASNDSRYESTLLLSGSFYDDCKVGKLDEFDYMVKNNDLSRPGLFKFHSSDYFGFVKLEIVSEDIIERWSDFVVTSKDEAKESIFIKFFSVENFQSNFDALLNKALEEVAMPANWARSPGTKKHGPCAMLEFLINGIDENPLYVAVDIAPCISFPTNDVSYPFESYIEDEDNSVEFLSKFAFTENKEIFLVPFTYDETIKDEESETWSRLYSNKFRVSFSFVENQVFSLYTAKSVEKRLFRILKILKDEYLQDDPGRFGQLEIQDDGPPSTIMSVCFHFVPSVIFLFGFYC